MKDTNVTSKDNNPNREGKQARNHNPQPAESGNPFITFKRFADAQAGYVLKGFQTLAELPSTLLSPFDARSSESSTTWKQRLREKAQEQSEKRQRVIEEAHLRPDEQQGFESDFKVADEQSRAIQSSPRLHSIAETLSYVADMDDEGESDGLSLYMPITPSFLSSLQLKQIPFTTGLSLLGCPSAETSHEDIQSHMSLVHAQVYHQLVWQAWQDELPAGLSVLPYLMHSPYSPLVLGDRMPKRSRGADALEGVDSMPYTAAFQDLLAVSQGREMQSLEDLAVSRRMRAISNPLHSLSFKNRHMLAADNTYNTMSWLDELNKVGLLQAQGYTSYFQDCKITPWRTMTRENDGHDCEATEIGTYEDEESAPMRTVRTTKDDNRECTEYDLYEEQCLNAEEERIRLSLFDHFRASDTPKISGKESRSEEGMPPSSGTLAKMKDNNLSPSETKTDSTPQASGLFEALEAGFDMVQQLVDIFNTSVTNPFDSEKSSNVDSHHSKTSSSTYQSTSGYTSSSSSTTSEDGSWQVQASWKSTHPESNIVSMVSTTNGTPNQDGTATLHERREEHLTDGSVRVRDRTETITGISLQQLYTEARQKLQTFQANMHKQHASSQNHHKSTIYKTIEDETNEAKHASGQCRNECCSSISHRNEEEEEEEEPESAAWEAYGRMIKANIEARDRAEKKERAVRAETNDKENTSKKKDKRGWFWA